jgi:hypothetical protein
VRTWLIDTKAAEANRKRIERLRAEENAIPITASGRRKRRERERLKGQG